MTRLLYLTTYIPYGFGEAFLIAEAKELLRQGVELLIVPRSPTAQITNRDAESLVAVTLKRRLWSPRVVAYAAGQALRHPLRFLKLLCLLRPRADFQTFLQNLAVVPKGLWLAGVAKRWQADHIHSHWVSSTGTMGLIAGQWSGIPWSFTAHRGDIVTENLLDLKSQKASFRRFISHSGNRLAQSLGAAERPEKTEVIHMGVVLPPMSSPQNSAKDHAPVYCVGNLDPVKGHTYLLQAIALLKQRQVPCSLHIAGCGCLRRSLAQQVSDLAIDDRVRFVELLPHDRLLQDYREGNVAFLVLPSIDLGHGLHEGIPVALMEAMAHGVPVISTNTGGIPELLGDGAGIVVPACDPVALADAMQRLIEDPELRRRLALAGRRKIEEDFDVEKVVARLRQRIEAATREGTRRTA